MTSYSQKLGGLPVTLFTNQHANGVDMAKRTHTQMLSERACKSFRTCETKVPEPFIFFNTTIFYKFHCLTFKLHQPLFASPSNFLCLPSPQFPPLPPPPITSRHISLQEDFDIIWGNHPMLVGNPTTPYKIPLVLSGRVQSGKLFFLI